MWFSDGPGALRDHFMVGGQDYLPHEDFFMLFSTGFRAQDSTLISRPLVGLQQRQKGVAETPNTNGLETA